MRSLIVSALVSLDGVFGDPRSWASEYFDDDSATRSLKRLMGSDAMLMGRGTYEYFAPAWPTMSGPYPDRINAIRKYVFSSTLSEVDWHNSTIVTGDPTQAVEQLKEEGDADLVIYGYGKLAQTLLEHDLVDVLDFWVHPAVIGGGTSVSRPGQHKALQLTAVESWPTGVVSLRYGRP
ncbi:MAG TPA: dihydrofolate reductase family protein [Acidimicrobiales bacterium]